MIISRYVIEFVIFSFFGWVFECIYCTLKTHEWQNRGFLFGPVCPIYGSGAVMASIVFHHIHVISGRPDWQLFLICAGVSAVLEYVTSVSLEKLFHARWWDYRDMPLNINGRICLPATIGFGITGLVIIRYILPSAAAYENSLPPLFAEAIALGMTGLISADTAVTAVSLTSFLQKLEAFEEEFNKRAEHTYQLAADAPQVVTGQIQEYNAAMRMRLQENAKTLTARQRKMLFSIKRMTSESRNAVMERMKSAAHSIRPHDRQS